MKKKALIPIVVILVVAGGITASRILKQNRDAGKVLMSGNIEATDVRLGFKISGRLAACLVDEGDAVKKGAPIAILDSADQKIAVDMARAGLDQARAVLAELENGSRPEELDQAQARVRQASQALLELTRGSRSQDIETAKANLDAALAAAKAAESKLDQARSDRDRYEKLVSEKNVSVREFELYRTQYEVAQNSLSEARSRVNSARQALSLATEGPRKEQIEKARAALSQAKAEAAMAKTGPRKEKIDQARARVAQAEASLAQARQQLAYTELFAPMDGIIQTRSAEPGEFITPLPACSHPD